MLYILARWDKHLSKVEIERILMCGLQTMTSSIAAVPTMNKKSFNTTKTTTYMISKINNCIWNALNHNWAVKTFKYILNMADIVIILFNYLLKTFKVEYIFRLLWKKKKQTNKYIPYAVMANGRRTICFNFWLKL